MPDVIRCVIMRLDGRGHLRDYLVLLEQCFMGLPHHTCVGSTHFVVGSTQMCAFGGKSLASQIIKEPNQTKSYEITEPNHPYVPINWVGYIDSCLSLCSVKSYEITFVSEIRNRQIQNGN